MSVHKLFDKLSYSCFHSPETLAKDFLERLERKEIEPDGLLMLPVYRGNDRFEVGWSSAQLRVSEAISAVEIAKHDMIHFLQGED